MYFRRCSNIIVMKKRLNLSLKPNFSTIIFTFIAIVIVIVTIKSNTNSSRQHTSHYPKVLCLILTDSNDTTVNSKPKVVYDAWAKHCDKALFITVLDPKLNDTSIEKEIDGISFLQPKGFNKDHYKLLTDKMFKTIIDLYEKYNYFDWYLKADDNTFIFVNNLKRFLTNKDIFSPVTYGYDFKKYVENGYHSGGGGYVWSKEAGIRIGMVLTNNYSYCDNSGIEDLDVAKCFRKVGVSPESSLDELGRERFHAFNMQVHLLGNFPDWIFSYAKNPLKKGKECCSESTISFHYINVKDMRKIGLLTDFYESTKLTKNISINTLLYQFI